MKNKKYWNKILKISFGIQIKNQAADSVMVQVLSEWGISNKWSPLSTEFPATNTTVWREK